MSPPLHSGQAESGRDIKQLLAHKFRRIGQLSNDYLFKDMDEIALETIKNDIRYLEKIHLDFNRSRKGLPAAAQATFAGIAKKIENQVTRIIPLLYSARGAKQSKDMDKFYEKIQASRFYWQNILDLLRDKLR